MDCALTHYGGDECGNETVFLDQILQFEVSFCHLNCFKKERIASSFLKENAHLRVFFHPSYHSH